MNRSFSKIAIYSRKSKYTGAGDSIENQIEMCKDYSKLHFGSDVAFSVYEDEGFSGKNIDRPEFQHFLRDLRESGFDALVCYRLDRISRSVSDFSSILDELTDSDIAFISIRENFDTSTPMGRAMIHIASVFAELERETIAERVKDNKYKLYRTGKWQGGIPPMGFTSQKMQSVDEDGDKRSCFVLVRSEDETETVKLLFEKYLELGSISRLETYLLKNHIATPAGKEFSKGSIRQILCNPVYATNDPCVFDFFRIQGADLANAKEEYDGRHGLIGYGKTVTAGTKNASRSRAARDSWIIAIAPHGGVISGERWVQVQTDMLRNKDKYPRTDSSHVALLSGLIRCGKCGAPMMIKGNRVSASGEKSFYYKCSRKDRSGGELCDVKNIVGLEFDKNINSYLKQLFSKGGTVYNNIINATDRVKSETVDYTQKIKALDTRIKENDAMAEALAVKLAKSFSEETDAPIYAAMQKFTTENVALKRERELLIQKNMAVSTEQFSLALIQETVKTFCDTIDTLDLSEKRRVLKLLVKSITWNGDDTDITLFTDEMSPKKKFRLGNLRCDRRIVDPVCKLAEGISRTGDDCHRVEQVLRTDWFNLFDGAPNRPLTDGFHAQQPICGLPEAIVRAAGDRRKDRE